MAVLISRSSKEVRTYLHVQVREDTAKLGLVRQLLCNYLRDGKAWKAQCTEETAVTSSPVNLCREPLCNHCTCVHFRMPLESQAKRCFHIVIASGCTDQHTAHSTPTTTETNSSNVVPMDVDAP